jgi:hypothetical protein
MPGRRASPSLRSRPSLLFQQLLEGAEQDTCLFPLHLPLEEEKLPPTPPGSKRNLKKEEMSEKHWDYVCCLRSHYGQRSEQKKK